METPRISKQELREQMTRPGLRILDVRKEGDYAESDFKIPRAIREDPQDVETWMNTYPKDQIYVLYCA